MSLAGLSDLQVELLILVHAAWHYLRLFVLVYIFTSLILRRFHSLRYLNKKCICIKLYQKLSARRHRHKDTHSRIYGFGGKVYASLFFLFSQCRAPDQPAGAMMMN